MSQLPDALHTISELGATFAGFAALVSVLALRRSDRRVLEVTRLHVAVAGSLIVAIGGLIPSVVDAHVSSSQHLWRISAVALFVINYAYAVVYTRWGTRLRGDRPYERLATHVFYFGLEAVVLLSLVACFVGFGSGAAFYLTALVGLLMQSAAVFLGIVTSIVEYVAGEDDT